MNLHKLLCKVGVHWWRRGAKISSTESVPFRYCHACGLMPDEDRRKLCWYCFKMVDKDAGEELPENDFICFDCRGPLRTKT